MTKGKKLVLLLGSIPFLTLVFALPFVNRVQPVILGLPFILFWILLWVFLTPFILMAAYRLEKKAGRKEKESKEKEGKEGTVEGTQE